MNILVTGGTGFIGSALCRELKKDGHDLTVTTRKKRYHEKYYTWHPPDLLPQEIISKADVVVNLAGEPIAPHRWTEVRKKEIMASRVNTTSALVNSAAGVEKKPALLISASAVGYYGHHEDETLDEDSPPGDDFLACVCKAWEAEAHRAADLGIRVVIIRIAPVLGRDGGILAQMITPFKLFAGGALGSGRQWFPWIHRDDLIGIFRFAIYNDNIAGTFNGASPDAVTNKEFSSALGRALSRPSVMSVPAFVIKTALGELGEMLLNGQRVIPDKIIKAGYRFKYPELAKALASIFKK